MTKTVRGYLRGLEILQALSEWRIATAAELAEATGLPRPTAHRLLGTLVDAGYAMQVGGSQYYALAAKVRSLSDGYDDLTCALEIAEPHVRDLSQRINWPCYLHSVDEDAVTTRVVVRSPRELGYPRPGGRLPLAHFSAGRAHLAAMDDAAAEEKITNFDEASSGRYAEGLTAAMLRMLVAQTRQRGFGFRENGVVPRTCSFAVPVHVRGEPLLYLTTNFILSTLPLARAVDTHMTDVMDTVQRIEGEIRDRDPDRPAPSRAKPGEPVAPLSAD